MFVYRKDLFGDAKERAAFKAKYKYDLAAPSTTAQMRDVAEFFTRPPKSYGFAPFTKMSEGTTVEAIWVLATFGVRLIDDDLNLVMDDAKATNAFAWYLEMMKFAPPGATAWHHAERMAAYSRGRVAQMMTWPSFVKDLENPGKSLVAGKNDYALPPAGPDGKPAAVAGTWALAIPKSSKQKELAAEFAAWWGSHSFGKSIVEAGMNPARRDLLEDAALAKANPWFPGILKTFEVAVVRPRFPDYNKVSDVVSQNFTKMVSRQITPAAAVKGMREGITPLLASAKK
jgi:multiple sugar transport system substrate-binding protein